MTPVKSSKIGSKEATYAAKQKRYDPLDAGKESDYYDQEDDEYYDEYDDENDGYYDEEISSSVQNTQR